MILKFIFNETANNGVIEKILIKLSKSMNMELGLSRDLTNLYAYIKGEKEELENFSKKLASELPLSIFLNSLNAEVTDEFKNDLDRNFPNISLPPCPKCLREVKDPSNQHYFDMFHHCDVCGYKVNKKCEVENGKLFFDNLAEKLKKEGKISIQTMNGAYEVNENLENAEFIIARDLANIAKYFMSFEGDAKALASIEKPFIVLKTNPEFKKTYGISAPAYHVKLPDCMVSELLFEAGNFQLLGFKKCKNPTDLNFEVKVEKPLFAVVTDSTNKDILIEKGDRGIIPKFEKNINTSGKYKDYVYKNGIIDTKENIGNIDADETKPVFAGFYGVMNEWELENKNIMGFCFYKNENKILINSPKFGLVEYIDFKFYFNNTEEIFNQIGVMNKTGPKLIKNFREKRPQLFEHALNSNIKSDKKGIYYLWGIVAIILGMADNIDEGFEKLIKFANEAMTKKGPRIDYKMNKNNLNPLYVIRTAMSFNLAGVDNDILSFGVIESFAEFLSNQYEMFHRDNHLNGAIIVGDLFRGEFLNKIYSYIEKNYPVFTPKALQMSGGVEALGNAIINKMVK